MNENELSLMTDIFDAISGADEWSRRQMEDKCISDADNSFACVQEKLRPYLTKELFNELDGARARLTSAYGDAGIMYGIYVASVLRDIGRHSTELSAVYSERMNG